MLLCVSAAWLGGRGLTDEAAVSLQGDMPRYLLNGVFFRDVVGDMPLGDITRYTKEYYARYPALSLGHHPLLLPVVQAGTFAIFGISVTAGRATILLFLLAAIWFWFRLVRDIYGVRTAVWSTALLITTPHIVELSQAVLSEIPTLALVIASVYYLRRYTISDDWRHAAAFGAAVVLSAYAKQLAAFMLPVYAVYFVYVKGLRGLLSRQVWVLALAIALLLAPLAWITIKMSPFNVALVSGWVPNDTGQWVRASTRWTPSYLLRPLNALWHQLDATVLVLSAVSAAGAILRRDKRAALFLIWIVMFAVQVIALGFGVQRLMIYWLPAFCLLAAAIGETRATAWWGRLAAIILAFAVSHQLVRASQVRPAYAGGYEQAARFVVEQKPGDAVLFSGLVDSGYFVFFVRKHDPERGLIVLRADKLLTTSLLSQVDFKRRIMGPEEIYPILRHFGVRFLVLEDLAYPEGPLRWLSEAVRGDRFVLRRRIPVESRDRRLRTATLSIYEFKDAGPADPSARLTMDIPLVQQSIEVPMADLLSGRQRGPR